MRGFGNKKYSQKGSVLVQGVRRWAVAPADATQSPKLLPECGVISLSVVTLAQLILVAWTMLPTSSELDTEEFWCAAVVR